MALNSMVLNSTGPAIPAIDCVLCSVKNYCSYQERFILFSYPLIHRHLPSLPYSTTWLFLG